MMQDEAFNGEAPELMWCWKGAFIVRIFTLASLEGWRLKVLAWDNVIFWNELLCNNTLPVGVGAPPVIYE
jgi:hypothetical protein